MATHGDGEQRIGTSEDSQIGSLDIRYLSLLTWDVNQFFSVGLQTPWPGNVAFKTSETPPVEIIVRNTLDEQVDILLHVAFTEELGKLEAEVFA